jgi:hypothetical protein
VIRTVLNPASPLFKEARYLLAEEPSLRDKALYHSVLAAVAEGHRTRGAIARFVGRRDDALQHPLTVLEDAGLLRREADAFRTGRSTVHITEPLISFYHAVMRPEWTRLERPGQGRDGVGRRAGSVRLVGPRAALRAAVPDLGHSLRR